MVNEPAKALAASATPQSRTLAASTSTLPGLVDQHAERDRRQRPDQRGGRGQQADLGRADAEPGLQLRRDGADRADVGGAEPQDEPQRDDDPAAGRPAETLGERVAGAVRPAAQPRRDVPAPDRVPRRPLELGLSAGAARPCGHGYGVRAVCAARSRSALSTAACAFSSSLRA